MRIKTLHVRNFRALEEIDVDFEGRVNVIVGPNAIGKTTLLEAIRLVKAVAASRSQNEAMQSLSALGAVAPYNPQRVFVKAIARDANRKVEIRCEYLLDRAELERLGNEIPRITTTLTLRSLGQNARDPNLNLAFLSSPQGREALASSEKQLREAIEGIRNGKRNLFLDFEFDPNSGRFESADQLGATLFSFLDGLNSPSQTVFSYFPADRALPLGEQPVQLGAADAANQIESHVSQPQLKYSRLKNTIFNAVVTSDTERGELIKEFGRIFDGILKGRRLVGVGINDVGFLSINVQDVDTGRTFDLDGMSSGEKGLILTFLLIGRSVVDGGIILLDEPELHLNPAVCKDLLSFLVDNYIIRKNLQAIICSHSPEILGGAFEKEECSLYHLVSERVLSKIRYKDEEEITQALSRLGTSESEGLLYNATVFVEGPDDADLLQEGFGDLLRRFKVKDLGGRREIEKQILQLQEAERRGTKLSPRYFIFDRDGTPTGITDSDTVKVLQWDRRCLENYLIDLDVLTGLLKDPSFLKDPLANQGEVSKVIRDLAMSQIDEYVAREVYSAYKFEDPNFRKAEIRGKNVDEIANALAERLEKIKGQIGSIDADTWKAEFKHRCRQNHHQQVLVWGARWMEICDGKRLFEDLYRQRAFKLPLTKLKRRIILDMRSASTANWRAIDSLLKRLVGIKT